MPLPAQNHLAWKISITIVHVIAVLWTALRLHHRLKSRFWWDDAAVGVALIADVFSFILFWVKYKGHDILFETPLPSGGHDFLWSPWFAGFLYSLTLWFSRISLMLSLARIFTVSPKFQKLATGTVAFFFACFVVLNLTSALSCKYVEGGPWWIIDYSTCLYIGPKKFTLTSILTICIDTLSDLMIVAFPLSLVKKMRIRRRTRDLMIVTFCGSIITMSLSVVYLAIFIPSLHRRDGLVIYVSMSHLHASTSLMIANLLVDLLIVYRFFHKSTGLSTFSDGVDSEFVTDGRGVEATPLPEHSGGGAHEGTPFGSESSMGQLTLTPISTAIQTESRATDSDTASK